MKLYLTYFLRYRLLGYVYLVFVVFLSIQNYIDLTDFQILLINLFLFVVYFLVQIGICRKYPNEELLRQFNML